MFYRVFLCSVILCMYCDMGRAAWNKLDNDDDDDDDDEETEFTCMLTRDKDEKNKKLSWCWQQARRV